MRKIPLAAWLAGAAVTGLLLLFAWPVLVPYAPLPKIALATLDFIPLWNVTFAWTHPGWLVGEVVLGLLVTAGVTLALTERPTSPPGARGSC